MWSHHLHPSFPILKWRWIFIQLSETLAPQLSLTPLKSRILATLRDLSSTKHKSWFFPRAFHQDHFKLLFISHFTHINKTGNSRNQYVQYIAMVSHFNNLGAPEFIAIFWWPLYRNGQMSSAFHSHNHTPDDTHVQLRTSISCWASKTWLAKHIACAWEVPWP